MLCKEDLGIDNLIIYQDTDLYKFTSDSILLSRFAKAKKNDVVADFCSGCGIVGLNFYALNQGVVKSVDLFEMQTPSHELALLSVNENNLSTVITPYNVKLQDVDKSFNGKYSLVLCNPPYMKADCGFSDPVEARAVCKIELSITLKEIVYSAKRVLKHGGRFVLCHRADRLGEIIFDLKSNTLEPKRIQFVTGADDKTPYLVLIESVKGGKEGVEILPNLTNTTTL